MILISRSSCHLSRSLDGGFLLVTTASGVVHVLDSASRHCLYEVPVPGATAAFYTFGDRFIIAHKVGTLTLWEATSPTPTSIPDTGLCDGLSIYCSGIDSALCEIRLIDDIPRRRVILQNPPLDCTPSGYQLQTQPCTTIPDLPCCIECQDGNICLFRGSRFLPLNRKNPTLIRDGPSYPMLFGRADGTEDLLGFIKVRLLDIWAIVLSTINIVLHRGSNPATVGAGFGRSQGCRWCYSHKIEPLLYAILWWVP